MKLGFLQDVYDQPGPFATVYLDTSADAEDASKAVELRWRSAKDQLSEQGTDAATLQAIEDRIGQHAWQTGKRGQVIVAAQSRVVFEDELPEPPNDVADDERAHHGPLPHLLPYMRLRGARIPYVLALVDHQGADVKTVNAARGAGSFSVEGDGNPVHKSKAAGEGSEQRHQNAVEEQWKRNAGEVAAEIVKQAAEIGADMIVLAGDVQQRRLVREELTKGWQDRVVETEAGHRDRKASDATVSDEVSEAIRSEVEARVAATVRDFERERGQNDRAVEGWPGVIKALQREQVQTVLWTMVPGQQETSVPVGSTAGQIALEDAELKDMGVDQIDRVPASEAVMRTLATSDAELVLAEPGNVELSDGVGAVLRYSDT